MKRHCPANAGPARHAPAAGLSCQQSSKGHLTLLFSTRRQSPKLWRRVRQRTKAPIGSAFGGALSDVQDQLVETYQREHNQPKDIAGNVRIKCPDYSSYTCLLVPLERIACCPFQHGPLLSSALRVVTTGMKRKGAPWFPVRTLLRMRTLKLRSGSKSGP